MSTVKYVASAHGRLLFLSSDEWAIATYSGRWNILMLLNDSRSAFVANKSQLAKKKKKEKKFS